MAWHGEVWVEFCDRFPARYPFLVEGPAPRLLINRAWWASTRPHARRAAFNAWLGAVELPGMAIWSTPRVPGYHRLAWTRRQSFAWWEALIAQEPEAPAPARHGLPDQPG